MEGEKMRNSVIEAFDLPSCWYKVIVEILDYGYERPVFRGAREEHRRKELDSVTIHVTNPSIRPLVPDVPEGVPPPTSMKYVNEYLRYLITPDKSDWEDYTYGERIGGLLKLDLIDIDARRVAMRSVTQLDYVIKLLKETPETNRAVIEVGRAEDLSLRHPPCLRYIQMKVRYGKLHMWLVFRSWDAWGGLPNNLAALQLLKEHIAKEIDVDDGEMFVFSAGLHLYDDEWELAEKVRSGRAQTTRLEVSGQKDTLSSKKNL